MKQNYETCLVGKQCILVPYRRAHVERYHAWMQSPALLQATGSEPLTLDEEYEMQASWRADDAKCTFIVLQRSLLTRQPPSAGQVDDAFVVENLGAMVGDINLFLSEEEEEDEEDAPDKAKNGTSNDQPEKEPDSETSENSSIRLQAELDIMVAEESARGQGIGKEASCLMMLYGIQTLGIRRYFCKINEDNTSSLALFRKLRFEECDYAACFKQYEYQLKRESPEELTKSIAPFLETTVLHTFQCASDIDVSN